MQVEPHKTLATATKFHAFDGTISVVVVVWNAQKYVLECLESLREHCGSTYTEVIVVDNASTDGTPELIAELFPEFTLIRNQENLGFAKANNIGMSRCSGDYVCLVNSDVKFRDDCLASILRYLTNNPDVAMVGPSMLSVDGTVRRSTMRFPTIWNLFAKAVGLDRLFKHSRFLTNQMMSDFDHLSTRSVEVLNGWLVMVRRSALEKVGLLDPQFFMYGEDVDWCYRFRQAAEKIVFFSGAGAIHYGGASSANAPIRFRVEMKRADWKYWKKHHGWLSQQAYLGTLSLHHTIRFLGCAIKYLCPTPNRTEMMLKVKMHQASLQWIRNAFIGADETISASLAES